MRYNWKIGLGKISEEKPGIPSKTGAFPSLIRSLCMFWWWILKGLSLRENYLRVDWQSW